MPWILATRRQRTRTLIFLLISCISAVGAVVVGIDDNPLGIGLAFSAVAGLILALVHPWRAAKQFGGLLLASVIGFFVFVVLHNAFDALAVQAENMSLIRSMLQGISVVTFFLAVLVCPVAVFIGAIGAIVTFFHSWYRSRHGGEGMA